jgi:hypothetical protein
MLGQASVEGAAGTSGEIAKTNVETSSSTPCSLKPNVRILAVWPARDSATLTHAVGYFHEEDFTAATPLSTDKNADEVMAEQFRREFLEAETARMQPRKPAMPPSKGDIKDQPKGPKMGGSRSARAAAIQRAQEEQDKKMKR